MSRDAGIFIFFSVASNSFWWTMAWCATKVDTIQEDLGTPVRQALPHKGFGEGATKVDNSDKCRTPFLVRGVGGRINRIGCF